MWFLNSRQPEYETHIFSTRFTISFTKTMLDIIEELSVPVILAVSGVEKAAVISEILSCVKAFVKRLRYIKDNECCVYYQTLEYLKTHSNKWFSAEEVAPDLGSENVCIYLDKKWKCRFRCGERMENCNIKLENVESILRDFCKDDIMKPNDEETRYKYFI